MRTFKLAFSVALASGLIWTAGASAATQENVFNPHCVSRVDITAPMSSLDALDVDPKGEYQPATMVMDVCDTEVLPAKNITFRLKGSGSFQSLDGKAAFKIKMSSANRIDGLKSLTLNNMVQDDSMIHEALAYKAFRAVAVAAPRAGYAIVSITNSATGVVADYGLHANIESLDDRFLNANYGSGTWGHLYESPAWQQHPTGRDIVPADVPNFETEETAEGASPTDLLDAANVSAIADHAEWWTAFQQKFDVAKVLRLVATELYVGDWDGYTMSTNNYFLHSSLAGVFDLIPWGKDHTFEEQLPLDPSGAPGQVFNRCMNVPACRAEFRNARNHVAETVIGLDLVNEAQQVFTAIAPAVAADTRRPQSLEQHCDAANQTIAFLVDREQMWRTTYRVAGSGITSAQTSAPIDCVGVPPSDTAVPVEPAAAASPVFPTDRRKFTVKKIVKCVRPSGTLAVSPSYASRPDVAQAKLSVGRLTATAKRSPFNPKLKLKNLTADKRYRYTLVVSFRPQAGTRADKVAKYGNFKTCR